MDVAGEINGRSDHGPNGGEGKIDMQKQVVDYLPEFKGSNWDSIKMVDAANVATACSLKKP